jgi:hypothetical protein
MCSHLDSLFEQVGKNVHKKRRKKQQILCSVLDHDPDLIRIQSGQWIQNPDPDTGGKNDNKNIKECCRAEGFSCILDSLYGGLGISQLQNVKFSFSFLFLFGFLVI